MALQFDTSAALAAIKKKKRTGNVPTLSTTKPPGAGGPDGGRRPPMTSTATGPDGLTMSGASPTNLQGRSVVPGSNLTARNRRAKDPAARIRRTARAALSVTDIRNATPEQIKALRRHGLLPQTKKKQTVKGDKAKAIREAGAKAIPAAKKGFVKGARADQIKAEAKNVVMTKLKGKPKGGRPGRTIRYKG